MTDKKANNPNHKNEKETYKNDIHNDTSIGKSTFAVLEGRQPPRFR